MKTYLLWMSQLEIDFINTRGKWNNYDALERVIQELGLEYRNTTAFRISILGFEETIDIWPTTLRLRASKLGSRCSQDDLCAHGGTIISQEEYFLFDARKAAIVLFLRRLKCG